MSSCGDNGFYFTWTKKNNRVLTHLTLSLNSHRRAVTIFLARVEEASFKMRVTLVVTLIRSLLYAKHIPGRLRSRSGVPWSSGFMRKSSSRASAPSMRFSVLLNSCDNSLVTLSSISPETWVMQSSCDLGTFELCAKLLLGCSSQFSLFKATSFLLFRVAISKR